GDSYNDIGMLRYAGVGVAMANAPQAVKEFADYVTQYSNDERGIVEVIRRFFPAVLPA
uniref:HAD family hydrolase n=1 Tax=uncultured Megasphaera sp. TaxID=165188 RepID=UPI00265D0EB5